MHRTRWALPPLAIAALLILWLVVGERSDPPTPLSTPGDQPQAHAEPAETASASGERQHASASPSTARHETALRARVIDSLEAPVNSFTVYQVGDAGPMSPSAVSLIEDATGTFEIPAAQLVGLRGIVVEPSDPRRGRRTGRALDTIPTTDQELVFQLPEVGDDTIGLTGRVVDEDANPVAGAHVLIHATDGGATGHIGTCVTSSDGSYRGHVDGRATAGEYLSVRAGHVEHGLSDTRTWRVHGASADFHADEPLVLIAHQVHVDLVDENGAPLADHELRWSSDSQLVSGTCRTDAQGRAAARVPRSTRWRSDHASLGLAGSISHDVDIHGHHRRIACFDSETRWLEGTVLDLDGEPCAATVRLWSTSGLQHLQRTATSDSEGRFRMKLPPSGVRMAAHAYRGLRGPISRPQPVDSATITLQLLAACPVDLEVQTSQPWISGAGVQFFDAEGRLVSTQQVVPGHNEILALPPGTYTTSLLGAELTAAPLTLEVVAGSPTKAELVVEPCAPLEVSLTDFDLDLLEQLGASLTFEHGDGGTVCRPARGSSPLVCVGIRPGPGRFALRTARGDELGAWAGTVAGPHVELRRGEEAF